MSTGTSAMRPRNRKQLIAEAAGRVFNQHGFHATSMESIASDVGITAAALYRHFPSKYSLFVECVNLMADRLTEALDQIPDDADLATVLRAITEVTVTHRATGGIYRWEARYLEHDDGRGVWAKFARVLSRVSAAIQAEQPGADAELVGAAALGAIGSITMHRTALSRRRIDDLLLEAASRVATTDLATMALPEVVTDIPEQPAARTRRAEILAAAVPLFDRDGFTSVTIGRIAEEVGLAPSAIYRHYPGKADILAAACLQAASMLDQAVQAGLQGVDESDGAIRALARTYVAFSFEHRALTSVAEAEIAGLPEPLREPVVVAQREHIAIWEHHLRAAVPELDPRQARTLVHAGFGVVVEAGRALRWQDSDRHRSIVATLLVRALGVRSSIH